MCANLVHIKGYIPLKSLNKWRLYREKTYRYIFCSFSIFFAQGPWFFKTFQSDWPAESTCLYLSIAVVHINIDQNTQVTQRSLSWSYLLYVYSLRFLTKLLVKRQYRKIKDMKITQVKIKIGLFYNSLMLIRRKLNLKNLTIRRIRLRGGEGVGAEDGLLNQ